MKSENESAISLAVYFKSVKKWKHVLRKIQKTETKKRKKIISDKYRSPDLQSMNSKHYLLRHESQHRMKRYIYHLLLFCQ